MIVRLLALLCALTSQVAAQIDAVDQALESAQRAIDELNAFGAVGGAAPAVVDRFRSSADASIDRAQAMLDARAGDDARDPAIIATRIRAELARADLLLGAALASQDPDSRAAYLTDAANSFAGVRIGLPDHPLRQLGYVGGARVLDARHEQRQALDLLSSLEAQTRNSNRRSGAYKLWLESQVESLRIELLADPADADRRLADFVSDVHPDDRDRIVSRIALIGALAAAADTQRLADQGSPADVVADRAARAASRLRESTDDKAARLGALASLQTHAVTLTQAEHTALGTLLARAGRRDEALARFTDAGMTADALSERLAQGDIDVTGAVRVATTLDHAGLHDEAATAWNAILERTPPDDPSRPALIARFAIALDRAAAARPGADASRAAAEAFALLVDMPIDQRIRIDALTSWTSHARSAFDARTILETLDRRAELTRASLELRRRRAAAAWDLAGAERRQADIWPELEPELEDIRSQAIADADHDVARAAMLMLAIGLSDSEIARKPEALQILRARADIESLAPPEPTAAALELSLLVDLEFISEAEALASRAIQASTDPILAAPAMRVAEALAARDSLAECERAAALATSARSLASPTSPSFVDLSRRAATILASCNRPGAAIPLLESLLDQKLATDSQTASDIGLQLASLLADAGRLDDALARLDDTTSTAPESLALRGHLLTAAGRHADAVDSLAKAWRDLAPATPAWCTTTIDLADALSRIEGRQQEARDLLRAVALLYPDACTSSRAEINDIRSRLGMGG